RSASRRVSRSSQTHLESLPQARPPVHRRFWNETLLGRIRRKSAGNHRASPPEPLDSPDFQSPYRRLGTTAGRRPGRHGDFRSFPPAGRGYPHHWPKLSASQSKRQQRPGGRKETMSFSLCTVACRGTPKKNLGPALSSNRDGNRLGHAGRQCRSAPTDTIDTTDMRDILTL